MDLDVRVPREISLSLSKYPEKCQVEVFTDLAIGKARTGHPMPFVSPLWLLPAAVFIDNLLCAWEMNLR